MADAFDISIRSNLKEISKSLSALAYKQLEFATARTLTELAKEVQADEAENIIRTFKNPKKFTRNSVGVRAARKGNLTAVVFVKPITAKYLQPYEDGGNHVLPGNSLLNPKDIKLDANGQLPRNVLARLKARPDIFIGPVKTKGGMVNGVWQRIPLAKTKAQIKRRTGAGAKIESHLKLLIRFGDALPVKKHLNYKSRAAALVARRFNPLFGKNLAKAIATAR